MGVPLCLAGCTAATAATAVAARVLSGLAVLNCLQHSLLEAVQPRLLNILRHGTIDVQVRCNTRPKACYTTKQHDGLRAAAMYL